MLFTIVFPIWTLFLCAIGPFVGAYTERPEGKWLGATTMHYIVQGVAC